MATTTVSAPGKVLLAGGYLVLDRAYRGLVFGLDARIYVCVRVAGNEQIATRTPRIHVRSPQFQRAHWVYTSHPSKSGLMIRQTDESESNDRNAFIETTLFYTLTYLQHVHVNRVGDLDITILTDADYYSHTTSATENKFYNFGVTLAEAHKTGLGSSAALVTALTAAILTSVSTGTSSQAPSLHKGKIHNLAQAAHCAAQGKVGSGFDVAAAVYGSCLYRRFSPSILENVGEAGSDDFGEQLHRCVENLDSTHPWDMEIHLEGVLMPSTLRIVMCDVDCGSQTPGMVKKVLEWRKNNWQEVNLLWAAIQQGTEELCAELRRLGQLEGIERPKYERLRDIISTTRSLVREMSCKSGVAIEPPVQTELLDACSDVDGVVGGFVPGAGGYDAIVLIIENDDKTLADLGKLLDGWKSTTNEYASSNVGNVSLLKVSQDMSGLRVEPADICPP